MADSVFLSADSLTPDLLAERSYSYGAGPSYAPVLIDPAGNGEQASLLCAGNTRAVFKFGRAIYKLLNRQQAPATVLCKSTDDGATWSVLDSGNSPAFLCCSGYFDLASSTVYCAFNSVNAASGAIHLINFNLITETWGAAYGTSGAPTSAQSAGIAIWLRPDNTLAVLFDNRGDFVGTESGIGAAVYDLTGAAWRAPFDVGVALLGLTGWDNTLTVVNFSQSSSVLDPATGTIHCFFNTLSTVISPTWNNRVFYQQILLSDALGVFFDFPGQTAPFPAPPRNTQQLIAFSGPPMGNPVIVGDFLVLPVLMRNDTADVFPHQLANVYLGSPVDNPAWVLDTAASIDPGAFSDDTIYPNEAPTLSFNGSTLYAVFTAQDSDGQLFARLRLCQTSDLSNPAAAWSALTAYDLQTGPPPGFQSPDQELVGAAIFAPAPESVQSVVITMFGWKLYPISPCEDAIDAIEVPHLRQAK